jgi:hypothetical protein
LDEYAKILFIDYASIELEFDIDVERYLKLKFFLVLLSLQNLNSKIQNFQSNAIYNRFRILETKRNIEELNINSHGNNGKYYLTKCYFSILIHLYYYLFIFYFKIGKRIKTKNDFNIVDEMNDLFSKIECISYSQITDLKEIAEGGFGIVYKALIKGKVVAIKKLSNSQNSSKYFLNEVIFKFIIYI